MLSVYRILSPENLGQSAISSENFEDLYSFTLRGAGDSRSRAVYEYTHKHLFSHQHIQTIVHRLKLDTPDIVAGRQQLTLIFEKLQKYQLIGKYKGVDELFKGISEASDLGLEFFGIYYQWMTDMQIPSVRYDELKGSEEERTYLEALVRLLI